MSQKEVELWPNELGLSRNKRVLLALMSLAGGKIDCGGGYNSRFRIAVSMLTGFSLHTYKFDKKGITGRDDEEFRDDINYLGVYIDYRSFEEKNKDKSKLEDLHLIYELNELGKSYGKESAKYIRKKNPSGYKKLVETAKILSNPEMTAIKMSNIAENRN